MKDIIEGRNPVLEALKADREFDKILVAKGDRTVQKIVDIAKNKGVPVRFADRTVLDEVAETRSHQGIIAYVAAHSYADVEDILSSAAEKGEPPFIVILDNICDPHNLGSVLRTANAVGAHGIIIPNRRSVGLNSTVAKTSAGAIEYTPVARVANIAQTIDRLKKNGIWVYGTAIGENSVSYNKCDLTGAIAIVIGSEGDGISRLVTEKCDGLLEIPMMGEIQSLNASVAAGVVMYEILKQRMDNK